jgi:MerR family transcriptional regulator, light-induced transcriptional regulator
MSKYRIKTISKITNIPIDTIRNWEKRYSFLKPTLGENNEKFYTDHDIELLKKITSLLKDGGRISEIASRILNGETFNLMESENTRISHEVQIMIEDYYQILLGADLKKIDQMESLIEITVIFKNRIDYIYYPLLERIRQESAKKNITRIQEHFTTGHILNKLKGFLATSLFNYNSLNCSIICGTPSSSITEGGLLVLACNMKLKGHNIYYLGSELPLDELSAFSEKIRPAILALSIANPHELNLVIKNFENSKIPVCVGGMGVRLADFTSDRIGSIYLISHTGSSSIDKLASISLEYFDKYQKEK